MNSPVMSALAGPGARDLPKKLSYPASIVAGCLVRRNRSASGPRLGRSRSVGGIDTLRGAGFQVVQALGDVVDLVRDHEHADAVRIEGKEDYVDYEVLDKQGQRLAVRQAKTRQPSYTWGAAELAGQLCTWGDLDGADHAEFAFVTDGRLGISGQQLDDLIKNLRETGDVEALRAGATKLGRNGVPHQLSI